MKQLISLAGWNWRIARKSYGILLAAFAAQQLAVLLFMALRSAGAFYHGAGWGLYFYYDEGYQWIAFGAAFLAAGLVSAKNLWPGGKARSVYTWLTLPVAPSVRLAAQAVTAAAMELGVAALHLVLYFVSFWPVRLVEHIFAPNAVPQSLYEQFTRNWLLRTLLICRAPQLGALALTLAASALLLPLIFLHRGGRRLAAVLLTVVGALCCLWIVSMEQNLARYEYMGQSRTAVLTGLLAALAVLAAVLAFSWWWALRAIRRAEPA